MYDVSTHGIDKHMINAIIIKSHILEPCQDRQTLF